MLGSIIQYANHNYRGSRYQLDESYLPVILQNIRVMLCWPTKFALLGTRRQEAITYRRFEKPEMKEEDHDGGREKGA